MSKPGFRNYLHFNLFKLRKLQDLANSKTGEGLDLIPKVRERWSSVLKINNLDWNDNIPTDLLKSKYSNEFEIFVPDVVAAINVTSKSYARVRHGYVDYTIYGKKVEDFVQSNLVKELKFYTGIKPKNGHDSLSCFTAKTKVILEDKIIEISEVKCDDKILGQNGIYATRSDCNVAQELTADFTIFGFNDDEPFATPGHPFWTKEGWKALDSSIAKIENPNLKVSDLKIGDFVQKIKSSSPLEYEWVEVKCFSFGILKKGEKLYGLHLIDGPASYHANGYLVKMNYPIITEKRITDAFSVLSTEEKNLIYNQLKPILPLFEKSIGSFINFALIKALNHGIEE